jgi:hypothetical protein
MTLKIHFVLLKDQFLLRLVLALFLEKIKTDFFSSSLSPQINTLERHVTANKKGFTLPALCELYITVLYGVEVFGINNCWPQEPLNMR